MHAALILPQRNSRSQYTILSFFPTRDQITQILQVWLHTHTCTCTQGSWITFPHSPPPFPWLHLIRPPPIFLAQCHKLCFLLICAPVTWKPLDSLGSHPAFPVCSPQLSWNFMHNMLFHHITPPSMISCPSLPTNPIRHKCV